MPRWHLLTGEYPPSTGGVAAFTATVAEELASRGVATMVWTMGGEASTGPVSVRVLPDAFGTASRQALERELQPGDVVLLQYAPNALGARGMNVSFCRWLLDRSRRGLDARVFFHEPFFYFGWQPLRRNLLAVVQRLMAGYLLHAAREAYVSTTAWTPLLRPYAPGRLRIRWVPVSAGVVPIDNPVRVGVCRARILAGEADLLIGHFSAYPADLRQHLHAALGASLRAMPGVHALCIGRGSEEFVRSVRREPWASRVSATGALSGPDASVAIQSCDLFLQPYPDGVTTRRTTMLTLLAHGAAVVTTSGALTEPLWSRNGDLFVSAPAGNARALGSAVVSLAADGVRRKDLGRAARIVYERDFRRTAVGRALLDVEAARDAAAVGLLG